MPSTMLKRRSFLFAAPAIVAASTLMPISARFIETLIVPRKRVFHVEGWDVIGNRITATVQDPRTPAEIMARQPSFKFITRIIVL